MKTLLSLCSVVWLSAGLAHAQFVLDCACLAQQPGLHVTNCTATIPDLCAIVTNCFRGTVVPPPQIPPFQCSQTPTAGTPVGPGVYGITVTVQIPGVPPLQCLVPFQVVGPNAGQFTLQCAPNKTVNCDAQWGFDPPTVVNPCCPNAAQPNGGVVITVVSTTTNGTCPQVITRTWQGVDNCGQTATCSQTVTVVDTVPPTIACGPNQTVNCGQQWSFSTPTISDNCTAPSDLVLSIVSTTSAGTCPEVITRIWQVTDLCGNKTLCTETVTIQDLIPPTITCAPNKAVPCGVQSGFDPPSATDNCSSAAGTPVTIAVVSTVTNSFCPLVVTRTWSATDGCGNSSQCSQTVTVGGPGGLTLNCAVLAMLPELQTNACDGFVPALCPRALALAQQNCLCPLTCTQSPAPGTQYGPGTYPITITVSDGAGGTATCTVNFVVTAPPGGCNTNCVSPPPNMVAWWPLDELNGATFFADFSGNGNTAMVESGGPLGSPLSPTATPGMVAGSSYFIDNSTRGRAPNSGTLNFGSGSFSMDCWFWPVDQGPFNRWQPMIDKFNPGTLIGYMGGITNYISGPNNFGRVAITVGDGAASTYYSVATVNFFAWNFVGIIVDRTANTVRFNINGVLEAPIPLTLGGSINNSLDLLIGATQVGLNVTEMRLDEIELFDRTLNPSELADI